ncbi:MAG: hypothetical protein KDK07_11940 [Bauldia sp.]|nr:hypothetical protein [Paracoccaceae bacterium]MCB1500478.1 hypothetical protein [Bauldia sp.]
MTRIRKSYFTLEELASEWGLPEADLRYVAENGLLKLSVRVVGAFMEFGIWEEVEDGQPPMSIPHERSYYEGLVDLYKQDVFALFRDGTVELAHFLRDDGYASLLRDGEVVSVRYRDLLVRDDELRRFEAEVLPTLRVEATSFGDFTDFWYEGRRYRFTPTQAKVLRLLHDAALRGNPWQSGKAVLAEVGSHSLKLGDLFKRRPEWRDLVEADGCGLYRLALVLTHRRAA